MYVYIGGYMYVSKFYCHTIHKYIRLNYVIKINKLYVRNFKILVAEIIPMKLFGLHLV